MLSHVQRTHEQYARQIKRWGKLLATVSRRLSRELTRTGLNFSLKHRIKTVESLLAKQADRGSGTSVPITDLLGLRVVVPFLEDVDSALGAAERAFEVREIERKAEKLSYREFAYDSVHVVIVDPTAEVEFPLGCLPSSCEIQIRTILQDAWAEVEHELIYKSRVDVPDQTIKKKLAALNANLTLSDIIFQEIRDWQQGLRRWGSERFHELERRAASLSAADVAAAMAIVPTSETRAETSDEGASRLRATIEAALQAHGAANFWVAVRRWGEALAMQPEPPLRAVVYNYRGMAHFMLHDERAALDDFEASAACDERYHPARNNAALVWRRFGHLAKSLEEFGRSLAIESRQPDVHVLRCQTFLEAGDPAAALEAARAALAIDPDFAEAERLARQAEAVLESSER